MEGLWQPRLGGSPSRIYREPFHPDGSDSVTLGLALAGQDGIVLAADTQSGTDDAKTPAQKRVRKIFPISDYCALIHSGSHESRLVLESMIGEMELSNFACVDDCKDELTQMIPEAVEHSERPQQEATLLMRNWSNHGYDPDRISTGHLAKMSFYWPVTIKMERLACMSTSPVVFGPFHNRRDGLQLVLLDWLGIG